MASSISATSTTSKITFTFTLSNPIAGNYLEIGVTDRTFTNGNSSLSSSKKKYVDVSNSEIYSTSLSFTTTTDFNNNSLIPGSSYTFYGYARAANGNYYCVPADGSVITVRMQSETPTATAPYGLVCTKRKQPSSGSSITLEFNITVPRGTEELVVEMSTSNNTNSCGNFTTTTKSLRKTLAELTNVSGNTYSFSVESLYYLTTYYIHAYVVQRIGTASVASAWCSTEQTSTPLSRAWLSRTMISCGVISNTYFECSLCPNRWDDLVNSDYFSYLTFEFFYNGNPVAITHKRDGSSITALSNPTYKIVLTAAEVDNAPNLRTQAYGYAALLPNSSATLTAHVHIYSWINGTYLEPVDANGNTYVGTYEYEYTVQSIDEFSWTKSNGDATAQQTQDAYYAITHNGEVDDFSYLVWNDIVAKIKEVLDYLGYSWDSTYSDYANTKMSVSNKYLTAVRFNSARYNIEIHHATGITEKSAGERVYGSYLFNLVSKLNEWIDNI